MTFNIGSQSGGIINNVGGDQNVEGGQQGVQITHADARAALDALRAGIGATDLGRATPLEVEEIGHGLDVVDHELAEASPDPATIVDRLERVTRILTRTGALAASGAALVGPLTTLGQWLGPLGASLLRMLPG